MNRFENVMICGTEGCGLHVLTRMVTSCFDVVSPPVDSNSPDGKAKVCRIITNIFKHLTHAMLLIEGIGSRKLEPELSRTLLAAVSHTEENETRALSIFILCEMPLAFEYDIYSGFRVFHVCPPSSEERALWVNQYFEKHEIFASDRLISRIVKISCGVYPTHITQLLDSASLSLSPGRAFVMTDAMLAAAQSSNSHVYTSVKSCCEILIVTLCEYDTSIIQKSKTM